MMGNLNFKVDESKCIHCGLCVNDCIEHVIELDGNKVPKAVDEKNCIGCMHCFMICPAGAISIFDKNPDSCEKILSQSPDMLLNLIKSRRSDRNYKKENLDAQTLQKLKDMLKWVPTGCNHHKLHFSFVDDIQVMDELREHVNNKIINALTSKPIKAVADKFAPFTKDFLNGEDIIFRGAPHMLVVSNSVTAPCAKEDADIALSYFELYAQSLGVGTCWCGFGQICMMLFPELSEYLKIPEGYKSQYVMLFGPKAVNYSRTTLPNEVSISTAEKQGFEKLSAMKTAKRYFWNFIR